TANTVTSALQLSWPPSQGSLLRQTTDGQGQTVEQVLAADARFTLADIAAGTIWYERSGASQSTAADEMLIHPFDALGNRGDGVFLRVVAEIPNMAPELHGPAQPLVFTEGGTAIPCWVSCTVTDAGQEEFNNGSLSCQILEGVLPDDRLVISTSDATVQEVARTGEIQVRESAQAEAITIGSRLQRSTPGSLVIRLAATATPERVSRLIQAIHYHNPSLGLSTSERQLHLSINDGRGGSDSLTTSLSLQTSNHAPEAVHVSDAIPDEAAVPWIAVPAYGAFVSSVGALDPEGDAVRVTIVQDLPAELGRLHLNEDVLQIVSTSAGGGSAEIQLQALDQHGLAGPVQRIQVHLTGREQQQPLIASDAPLGPPRDAGELFSTTVALAPASLPPLDDNDDTHPIRWLLQGQLPAGARIRPIDGLHAQLILPSRSPDERSLFRFQVLVVDERQRRAGYWPIMLALPAHQNNG
ncbi:MAG: hypothetical protein ACOCXA_06530, partial [Planctomycetota bacterium]